MIIATMLDGVRETAFLFLAFQSCMLMAGTDFRRPPQHGAALVWSSRFPCPACGPGQVARLRGGGDDKAGSAKSAAEKPATRSWADLVRQPSKTPSPPLKNPSSPLNGQARSRSSSRNRADGEQSDVIPMERLNLNVAAGDGMGGEANDHGNSVPAMPFMTDAEIREVAMKQQGPGSRAGQDRELEPFECDDEDLEGRLEDDPETQLDQSNRVMGFDQFKVNEERFGIKTDAFNEDEYTAPINTSDPAYAEQVQRAEQLAAEIEGS